MAALTVHVDDVLRELRYTNYAGFAWHHANGRLARAQDVAVMRGWLAPSLADPRELRLTQDGTAELKKRREYGS